MDSRSLKTGAYILAPGGCGVEFDGAIVRKALGIPEVLQFLLEASVTIDLGLFSAWLYDKVKNSDVERIIIRKRVITEITQDGIRHIVEEEIDSSK